MKMYRRTPTTTSCTCFSTKGELNFNRTTKILSKTCAFFQNPILVGVLHMTIMNDESAVKDLMDIRQFPVHKPYSSLLSRPSFIEPTPHLSLVSYLRWDNSQILTIRRTCAVLGLCWLGMQGFRTHNCRLKLVSWLFSLTSAQLIGFG